MAELPPHPLLDLPSGRPPLGYLLRQAAAAHRLKMEHALADIAVTPPQFLVLTMLQQHPGCSNADLARLTSLSTPTMTVIVTNLKRRAAVGSRPHSVNKRIQHLDLTDVGASLLAAGRQRASLVEAELMTNLTQAQSETVGAWLLSLAG